MVPWVIAAGALLLAAAAWARAGRVARKLDTMTQSYWELRYDFTRLRSQVARLDPETAALDPSTSLGAGPSTSLGAGPSTSLGAGAPPASSPGQVAFVPLASIKKKG